MVFRARINNKFLKPQVVAVFVLAASLLTLLRMLQWILARSRYGLDFTDESFHLTWISNPWIYDVSVTQFGFIYHVLYQLCGGDITLLRQGNILITYCLALLLCIVFFRTLTKMSVPAPSWHSASMLILAVVLATNSLTVVDSWSPTPSYNSLAFQSLLLAGAGLLMAERTSSRSSIIGWIVIGVAGWLAFMAKPTTAAMLGLCIAGYLIFTKKLDACLLALAIAVAVTLLMVSALVIDGSVPAFVDRLRVGVEMAKLLNGGQVERIFRLQGFILSGPETYMLLVMAAAMCIFTHLAMSKQARFSLSYIALPLLLILLSWGVLSGRLPAEVNPSRFHGMLIWAVPIGVLAAVIPNMRLSPAGVLSRNHCALALCFFLFPHVCAFGTNGNYWQAGAFAGIFWILAALTLVAPIIIAHVGWRALLPFIAGSQLTTVLLLSSYMENPHRQAKPLSQNDQVVEIGMRSSQLMLSGDFADYFRTLRTMATRAGFQPGTPMIDMSGHSPGTLYAIGAQAIGQAWTIGGYKGSESVASAMLQRVPCPDIARAWLLLEPEGPRKLSSLMLQKFGIDVSVDFEIVADLNTPAGTRGYQKIQQQLILKPRRVYGAAVASCEHARMTAP